ncbi:hypothetical protein D9M71_578770 [compost metagenome]
MADAFAILEHHRVDRTDTAGLRREFVEQRDDRLLAWKGYVQPGVVHALGSHQQVGQGVAVELQLIKINQTIEVAQPLGITFMLVHGRCAGSLDAGADQPGQYHVVLSHGDHPFKR